MKTLILLVILATIFSDCRKKREIECTTETLGVSFIGFTPAEIDTVILRKFSPDTAIKSPLSSELREVKQTESQSGRIFELGHEWRWEISAPGAGKTFKIENIDVESKTTAITKDKNAECINAVLSSEVNGKKKYGPILSLGRND